MSKQFLVYAVDDDPVSLEISAALLADLAEVRCFSSGLALFQCLKEGKPDLLLLDIVMPDIDGLAICRQLKEDFETQDIPVLFVSGRDDYPTRLACYEAGAEDFICKPFEQAELLGKIRALARNAEEKAQLREQADYAQRTAMSAMVSMGELGVVLQFLSKSFACRSQDELAEAILASLRDYDLDGAVQLRLLGDTLNLGRNGRNHALESSILNHVRDSGRIFQFKTRCAFNYGHVTLLVNNMPIEDAERAGRVRDNVALLAEGADARLKSIETDILAQRRRDGIESALPTLYATLDQVQVNYRRNCFELTELMIEYQETLTKAFVHLGLSETQEEQLSEMANDFMRRVVGTQDASLQIVGDLSRLAEDLKALLKS